MNKKDVFDITTTVEVLHKPTEKMLICRKIGLLHWEVEGPKGGKVRRCLRRHIVEAAMAALEANRSIYEDQGLKSVG